MKKTGIFITFFLFAVLCTSGCGSHNKRPQIGVCLVAGSSERWAKEGIYMEEYARETGADIDVRIITSDNGLNPVDECAELVDNGAEVLILRTKDPESTQQIVQYARQKNVKLISYANLIENQPIDLYIGYDCKNIGQKMGKFLTEAVIEGDYIILAGDPNDKVVSENLYEGAMTYIDPVKDHINIILDANVPGWKPEEAARIVKEAIQKNGGRVDAILTPNDTIAGACAEVIKDLGITEPVVITGMDASEEAAKRIAAGEQSCTFYMDLHKLAVDAVEAACRMAKSEEIEVNSETDNGSSNPIPSYLISGQLVTKENLDKILIESGYLTREQVYE